MHLVAIERRNPRCRALMFVVGRAIFTDAATH